jgi:hypothetical protein
VQTAIKRYLDLQSTHKDHPKVADTGPTGVKRRLDECYKLSFKMNYARDKKVVRRLLLILKSSPKPPAIGSSAGSATA